MLHVGAMPPAGSRRGLAILCGANAPTMSSRADNAMTRWGTEAEIARAITVPPRPQAFTDLKCDYTPRGRKDQPQSAVKTCSDLTFARPLIYFPPAGRSLPLQTPKRVGLTAGLFRQAKLILRRAKARRLRDVQGGSV